MHTNPSYSIPNSYLHININYISISFVLLLHYSAFFSHGSEVVQVVSNYCSFHQFGQDPSY